MGEKTAFTKTSRPPHDSTHTRHPPNLASTFSSTSCQSFSRSHLSTNGRPRYRIGSAMICVIKCQAHLDTSSMESPKPTKIDLSLFSCSPEKSEKMSTILKRVSSAFSNPWMKKVVSSAYWSNGIPSGVPAV